MKGKAGIPRGLGVRSGASLGGEEEGLLESELEVLLCVRRAIVL